MKIYNNTSGKILICDKCGDSLGFVTRNVSAFKFSFICKCGNLASFEAASVPTKDGSILLKKDDTFICPSCNQALFRIYKHSAVNFAFKVSCRCDRVYDAYKDTNKIRRNLGRFASLDE